MKQTIDVTERQFLETFSNYRSLLNDNFTTDGLSRFYEYLEDNYPNYRLDVPTLCYDYTQYDNLKDFQAKNDAVIDEYKSIKAIGDKGKTVIPINHEAFIVEDIMEL